MDKAVVETIISKLGNWSVLPDSETGIGDELVMMDVQDLIKRRNLLDKQKKEGLPLAFDINECKYEPFTIVCDGITYGSIRKGTVDTSNSNYITFLIDDDVVRVSPVDGRGHRYYYDSFDEHFRGEVVKRVYLGYEYISCIHSITMRVGKEMPNV